jgi:hypothetical protein
MSKKFFVAIAALALAAAACGVNIDLPTPQPLGETVTDEIAVSRPDVETAHLKLAFGAGELRLAPGAQHGLVEGTATYNVSDLKPRVSTEGAEVRIEQGEIHVNGLPTLKGMKNTWDLKLDTRPLVLEIDAGAYQGEFDLGGLALTELTVNDGASEVTIDFSSANQEKMSLLTYKTGASNVTLKNLANANFLALNFDGGAGNYTLDFGGKLQRDGAVTIRSGMSNLTLVVPVGVPVTLKVNSGLSNVQFPENWTKSGNQYSQPGEGPQLTIVVEMGAGNLQITP